MNTATGANMVRRKRGRHSPENSPSKRRRRSQFECRSRRWVVSSKDSSNCTGQNNHSFEFCFSLNLHSLQIVFRFTLNLHSLQIVFRFSNTVCEFEEIRTERGFEVFWNIEKVIYS
uniref:Uncharacterized protein n=1 Tax=Phaseolus vulgaris TaxID=3885 RepID=V7C779_PHAVU|nr:hypothetical protein PHAVU_004G157400g [Phaseolus vulgaris]ESW24756.1 hypothetical protein PHAVU_004G157400g [Phaseolus vulgaris]